jgi:hypothetical protein
VNCNLAFYETRDTGAIRKVEELWKTLKVCETTPITNRFCRPIRFADVKSIRISPLEKQGIGAKYIISARMSVRRHSKKILPGLQGASAELFTS